MARVRVDEGPEGLRVVTPERELNLRVQRHEMARPDGRHHAPAPSHLHPAVEIDPVPLDRVDDAGDLTATGRKPTVLQTPHDLVGIALVDRHDDLTEILHRVLGRHQVVHVLRPAHGPEQIAPGDDALHDLDVAGHPEGRTVGRRIGIAHLVGRDLLLETEQRVDHVPVLRAELPALHHHDRVPGHVEDAFDAAVDEPDTSRSEGGCAGKLGRDRRRVVATPTVAPGALVAGDPLLLGFRQFHGALRSGSKLRITRLGSIRRETRSRELWHQGLSEDP